MTSSPPTDVGQRIRLLRERRRLSIRSLSERCGLSPAAISQIERGENSPTVSSLHQLATALGVSISDFFHDHDDYPAVFVPASGRLRLEARGVRMESLGIGLPYQQLEPFAVTVEPGAGNREQPVSHAGEEFACGLRGEIVYHVSQVEYRLGPGDSLLFDSSAPHYFLNEGSEAAVFLLVFAPRGGRASAQELHIRSVLEP